MVGDTRDVIEKYLSGDSEVDRCKYWQSDFPGKNGVYLKAIRVTDDRGSLESSLTSATPVKVCIDYELTRE